MKIRNNCTENCSQFQHNVHLLLQGRRSRCDPWFTQEHSLREGGEEEEMNKEQEKKQMGFIWPDV